MHPLEIKTIPITVDKSHLITIGERLYAESLELIRELVSNAYDADATHVWIEVTPYTLAVKDNGSGMDEASLRQYFNIGSQEKKFNTISPIFHRTRIGEFGIGKFAALAACDVFTIYTQKDDFAAKLTFDKNVWNAIEEWEIPIHILPPNRIHGNGITVTLEPLKKQLTLPDIERFLKERAPLKAPNFQIFLNGKRIMTSVTPGKKFPVRKTSSYGLIHGEIIMPNFPQIEKMESPRGIECFVKDVLVKRETFGFEYSHSFLLNRLGGEIHADFLLITSDRTRFITDSPEYKEFYRIMRQEIQDIMKQLKDHVKFREDKKADGILRDALSHIRKALKKNPEFAPETEAAVFKKEKREQKLIPIPAQESHAEKSPAEENHETIASKKSTTDRSSKRVRIKTLTGREFVARQMRIGNFNVVCRIDELGENSPAVVRESGIIFINRDHPLYRRFLKNAEALTLFVTELITQEIAKMRSLSSKEAFHLQNQLLTDAWA